MFPFTFPTWQAPAEACPTALKSQNQHNSTDMYTDVGRASCMGSPNPTQGLQTCIADAVPEEPQNLQCRVAAEAVGEGLDQIRCGVV